MQIEGCTGIWHELGKLKQPNLTGESATGASVRAHGPQHSNQQRRCVVDITAIVRDLFLKFLPFPLSLVFYDDIEFHVRQQAAIKDSFELYHLFTVTFSINDKENSETLRYPIAKFILCLCAFYSALLCCGQEVLLSDSHSSYYYQVLCINVVIGTARGTVISLQTNYVLPDKLSQTITIWHFFETSIAAKINLLYHIFLSIGT